MSAPAAPTAMLRGCAQHWGRVRDAIEQTRACGFDLTQAARVLHIPAVVVASVFRDMDDVNRTAAEL